MKNNMKISFFNLIVVIFICFSTVVLAAEPEGVNPNVLTQNEIDAIKGGTIGIIETQYTEDKGQATLTSTNYAIAINSDVFYANLTYINEEGDIKAYDGTITLNGEVVGNLGSVSQNEEYGVLIKIEKQISEGDFANLVLNIGNPPTQITLDNLTGNKIKKIKTDPTDAPIVGNFGVFTGIVDKIAKKLEKLFNELLLPFGDGILYIVSRAVGEPISIYKLLFNKVEKVDINYWEAGSDTSVKAAMGKVVTMWYSTFNKIALLVYMIVLIIVGIEILLKSTASEKAKYKDVFVSWVVGIIILFFFPYVMKYSVKLNGSVISAFEEYITEGKSVEEISTNLMNVSNIDAYRMLGEDGFVKLMLGDQVVNENSIDLQSVPDAMMQIRVLAQKIDRIVLTILYIIFIGQSIVLLFVYYKRAFMIAFLITIFPLVAMTYVIDKIGDKKAQSFGIWFKEYMVNVLVQMFHAAVYIIIIDAVNKEFIRTAGGNWLYMIMCVLFLFEGEKILRSIFNLKSSANTIGDLAQTGLAAYGAISSMKNFMGGNKQKDGNIAGSQDIQDVNNARAGIASRQATINATNSNAASVAAAGGAGATTGIPGGAPGANGTQNRGQYTGPENEPAGVNTNGFDGEAAMNALTELAMKRRLNRGFASGAVNLAGKTVGAFMGTTFAMAKGGEAKDMIAGAASGKVLGEGLTKPVEGIVNKLEQNTHGDNLSGDVKSGKYDGLLGLGGAMPPIPITGNPDIDEEQIIRENGSEMQELYRQALAEFAKVSATKGVARGREAYYRYIETHTRN